MTFPSADAITGGEAANPTSPPGALSEFYRAFNGRDLALMAQNWLSTEEHLLRCGDRHRRILRLHAARNA